MAVKSIIDVEVNDGAFKQFADLFAKYQAQLKTMPDNWKKVGEELDGVLDKTVEGVEAIDEATEGAEKSSGGMMVNFRQTFLNVTNQAAKLEKINSTTGNVTRHTAAQANHWKDMARSSKNFAGNVVDATRSLLKWASLTGLVSGLLGAGGLFGIARLATAAGSARVSSMGLGMSAGAQRAFGVNYGRVFENPEGFLSGVNDARLDVTKWGAFAGAGLNPMSLQGKNTDEITEQLIPALKKIADRTPEAMLGTVMKALGIDSLGVTVEDMERLKHTSPEELAEDARRKKQDTTALGLSPATLKIWQDLQVQLHRAGDTIETIFIKGLTPLAKPLENLSDAFVKLFQEIMTDPHLGDWISDLARGIKWLGDELKTQEFRDGVTHFIDNVEKLAHAIGVAFGKIADWIEYMWPGSGPQGNRPGTPTPPEEYGPPNPNAPPASQPSGPGAPFIPGHTAWQAVPGILGPVPVGATPENPSGRPADSWLERTRQAIFGAGDLHNTEVHYPNLPSGILAAVMDIESGGDASKRNGEHMGRFQIGEAAWHDFGAPGHNRWEVGPDQEAAAKDFDWLSAQPNVNGDFKKMLAGYNWGIGNLSDAIAKWGKDWEQHAPDETKQYIVDALARMPQGSLHTWRDGSIHVTIENATGGSAQAQAAQVRH